MKKIEVKDIKIQVGKIVLKLTPEEKIKLRY